MVEEREEEKLVIRAMPTDLSEEEGENPLREDPVLRATDFAMAQRPEEKKARIEKSNARLKERGYALAEQRRERERAQASEGEDVSLTK